MKTRHEIHHADTGQLRQRFVEITEHESPEEQPAEASAISGELAFRDAHAYHASANRGNP